MIFPKPFNKFHSQYFLIIYKKTAKLYILTNYFLSIYNAAIQRDRNKERAMPHFTVTLFQCFNLCIKAFQIHINAASVWGKNYLYCKY